MVSIASVNKPLPVASQRYAAALIDLASSKKLLPQIESDLAAFRQLLAESKELARFMASPLLRRGVKAKGLAAILEKAGADKLCKNFFQVVALNGRADSIASIIDAFMIELSSRRGELRASATSARPLSEAQVESLKAAILKAFAAKGAKSVRIDTAVDKNLLGGVRVQLGSFLFDGSLKGQLQKLAGGLG